MHKFAAIAILVLIGLSAVTAEKAHHRRSRTHAKAKQDPGAASASASVTSSSSSSSTSTSTSSSSSGSFAGNPAAGAQTMEEAEASCAEAAAAGAVVEEEAASDQGETVPPTVEDAGGPMVVLPDGTQIPLPKGCHNLLDGMNNGDDKIPPGEGPCAACQGEAPPPIREIQVLEWPEGKSQPIVIGKQLLTENKTILMVKVLSGEFDRIEAGWKAKEEEFIKSQKSVEGKQEGALEEYAAAIKAASEENADTKIEAALARALEVWGLEQSFGKEPAEGEEPTLGGFSMDAMGRSPEEIAAANAEEQADAMAVAEEAGSAGSASA